MTPVFPVSALEDGEVAACRIGRVEVLVSRVDGRYYATSGRCPHAGQSLAGGRLKGFELRCPLHAAVFDVRDGRCLRGPSPENLLRFPVMIDQGRVCVDVDAAP
jgi:naphthalene 1,2-dioxygenase system ferredoxin subunit